ncbi:methyltransferase [Ralstonia sp. A12]|uniref:L-histidine N(alpha)-methyltransferase n=1 Tax=Ralstonia sp. A12 TaxID=1217052 RepID=UPI0005735549|nr:L-histidine N(alpha)-methyltransferase [Ralstonia sp. A12]KHK58891.1 methyltransferase [Ralstonia sp. A12]
MQATKPSADAYARRALARLIQPQPTVDAIGAGLTFYQLFTEDDAALRVEAEAGLLASAASVSPKFFYDALGSRLFEAITDLPEYYPTRTEAAIFSLHAAEIALRVGRAATLIDLGAGNCEKAARLFRTLAPSRYVAIDISADFLRDTLRGLAQQHPKLPMVGIGADLCAPLVLPDAVGDGRRVWFYPGSSLGNFTPDDARAFLTRLREASAPGDSVLIGIDLIKDARRLEAAYDDPLGVTAAFNLNVLRNLNRLLGANFDVRDWRHLALYRTDAHRIEMHLEARCDVTVRWGNQERAFAAGERLHTENSVKYDLPRLRGLFADAGFEDLYAWTDAGEDFAVCHASVSR